MDRKTPLIQGNASVNTYIVKFFRNILRWNYPLSRKEVYSFLYFFLIITSYYIIKPLRTSRFLNEIGAENIPYFYLLNSFLIFGVVYLYNLIVKAFRNKRKLLLSVNGFLVLNIFAFVFLFNFSASGGSSAWFLNSKAVSTVFFIWASFFAVFVVSVFWSLMSSLYNTDEAKVSYGFIGLGGVLGGACGGSITEFFVTRIGESYLLFISGFLLFCCILITEKLFSIHDSSDSVEDKIVSRPASGVGESNETSTLELFRDPYVRLIAGIVLFMTMAGTIFDFQLKTLCQQDIYKEIPFQDLVNQVVDSTISPLNSSAETSKAYSEDLFKDAAVSIREDISKAISGFRGASIDRLAMDNIIDGAIGSYLSRPGFSTLAIHPSPDVVAEVRKKFTSTYTTQYFGWLFKKVSLLSLLVQAFLTARFHQTIGVPLSLLVLPVLSMIDLSFLFLFPVLATISIATIIQNGLSYSLMQSSKEQLFIPTSDTVRYRAKSMIDTFVFRFGDAMASILILLVTRFFGYGLRELSLVNILIVSVWIFVVFRCGKKYISRL